MSHQLICYLCSQQLAVATPPCQQTESLNSVRVIIKVCKGSLFFKNVWQCIVPIGGLMQKKFG